MLAHGANDTLIWEIWHVFILAAAENSIANYTVIQFDIKITQDRKLSQI